MTESSAGAHGPRTARYPGIRVMAHPRRRNQAEALLARLRTDDQLLVLDPDPDGPPSPLRTAACAWAGPYGEASHRLVLQDDVLPANGFLDLVAEAIENRPTDPIAFYSNWNHWNGSAVRLAALSGAGWARAIPDEYAPSLAVALPCALAGEFADYAQRLLSHDTPPDDEALAAFLRERNTALFIAVPNLVEHKGGDSLVGNDVQGPRLSPCFADDAAGGRGSPVTLGALDFYPHFFKGHVYGITPDGPDGRYVKTYWDESVRALGIDPSRIRELARREPTPAVLLRDLANAGLQIHHAVAAWTAAVLYGIALERLSTAPDLAPAGPPGPDPAVRARAVETIPLGGLAQVVGLPLLHRVMDPLRRLTEVGLNAGAELAAAAAPLGIDH
ncbi:hypothetical protein KPP03845_101307 [Streptomyces xanthophaeus]|uniref:hypothetical protein n=1 Tax=Streptomyces xanthophaeus TaxID=67385 RepID=UPI00233F3EBF|nr:hypothetical protein [Streptomyces xanthophaeus]WCD84984.1 hypothetical protein KPP03845_101307 [Streptomyces xanthophaeus]